MGTLERLDELMNSSVKGLFFHGSVYYCGCGTLIKSLYELGYHLENLHCKKDLPSWLPNKEDLLSIFKTLVSSLDREEDEHVIILPRDLLCVCLNEYDIGLFADGIRCDLCEEEFGSLDLFNNHKKSVHKYCQRIEGENILFERPSGKSSSTLGFFCPISSCKYSICQSNQSKFFSTFKLLKQHYMKVHASRSQICNDCGSKFATAAQLEAHSRSCGQQFCCECGSVFKQLESLQTHCRRTGHILDKKYIKLKSLDPGEEKLKMIRSSTSKEVPLAPKPSALHIYAALALSELSATNISRADIGIQTDMRVEGLRNSPVKRDSALDASRRKVTTETQTRMAVKRKQNVVNSQVQTFGEYLVRPKKCKKEKTSQGSQCRISPVKRFKQENYLDKSEMTTQTVDLSAIDLGLTVNMSDLWPLVKNTNGTQTSPRARFYRKISDDSEDESLPSLELLHNPFPGNDLLHQVLPQNQVISSNPAVQPIASISSSSYSPTIDAPLLTSQGSIDSEDSRSHQPQFRLESSHQSVFKESGGSQFNAEEINGAANYRKKFEVRQFSTETQTDMDHCLSSHFSWEPQVEDDLHVLNLPGSENLLSNMETQETQTHEDLLLCINMCTQTSEEPSFRESQVSKQSQENLVTRVCNTESQTSLTGLYQPDSQILAPEGVGSVETADVQLMTDFLL